MYLNAAWWYFSMLIQFYLIFPLLFWAARRFGPMVVSVDRVCCRIFCALYAACRLAAKVACGSWAVSRSAACPSLRWECHLPCGTPNRRRAWNGFYFAAPDYVLGLILYPAALQLYDGLVRVHLRRFRYGRMLHARNRRHCWNHFVIQRTRQTLRSRWNLFLRLVSHPPTLRHLAWASHSRAANLDVPTDLHPNLAVLSAWGMLLEKATNTLVNKLTFVPKTSTCLGRLPTT